MTRYVPWTLCGLLLAFGLLGSLATAQWEPQERETVDWFIPPPILESDLMEGVALQELCYLVVEGYHGGPVATMYRIKKHEANGMDGGWYLPPKVIEGQKRSVWRKLQEAFNATFTEGNRWAK